MNSLITSADQLNWITPDKLPADDCRGIDVEGAYALAVIDDDNLLAIYVDVIDDEVRVTMDRVVGDVRFTSDDPGEWTDIEAVLPHRPRPAAQGRGHPLERTPIMDPDFLAFQAAKKVADRFTDAVQRSTRAVADVRVARSAEFQGVWGVELHALKRDDTIDALMLMNDARYTCVKGDDLETHGCVAVLAEDGAIDHVPCIISYPLVSKEGRK